MMSFFFNFSYNETTESNIFGKNLIKTTSFRLIKMTPSLFTVSPILKDYIIWRQYVLTTINNLINNRRLLSTQNIRMIYIKSVIARLIRCYLSYIAHNLKKKKNWAPKAAFLYPSNLEVQSVTLTDLSTQNRACIFRNQSPIARTQPRLKKHSSGGNQNWNLFIFGPLIFSQLQNKATTKSQVLLKWKFYISTASNCLPRKIGNMSEKQLIVAVEGTAAMGPYWQSIVSDYLEKIIRSAYFHHFS